MPKRPQILLLVPSTSYRADAYVAAAARLQVAATIGTDLPAAVRRFGLPLVDIDFAGDGTDVGLTPMPAIAVDEMSAIVAAKLARLWKLPHHDVAGVRAAGDKREMRLRLTEAHVPVPRYEILGDRTSLPFPCVVKPPMLSGSQGVIRVNDAGELQRAASRIGAILERHPSPRRASPGFFELLIERFVDGPEVAVEALVHRGELQVLAIFDKPDDLDGPFFEETIYVTPSRHSQEEQEAITGVVRAAVDALGLHHGPIHAELRLSQGGPVLIEIAPRSIGGMCSQAFANRLGSLEERVIHNALDRPAAAVAEDSPAVGVMMIPVPRCGVLRAFDGVEEAQQIPHIDSVSIAVEIGQSVRTLPEGSSYLGFIFAHADDPRAVEDALRRAHAKLSFDLKPLLTLA